MKTPMTATAVAVLFAALLTAQAADNQLSAEMKAGEWNSFRIIEKGPHIQTWINGTQIEDFQYPDDLYQMNPEGFFGLQVHGIGKGAGPWSVRWKNIYIKELK